MKARRILSLILVMALAALPLTPVSAAEYPAACEEAFAEPEFPAWPEGFTPAARSPRNELRAGSAESAAAAAPQAEPPEGTPLADFVYTLDEEARTVLLSQYVGSSPAVVIPDAYAVDGESYRPILDSETVFRGNTAITSVRIGAGAGFLNGSMRLLFGECPKLSSIDLSETDTSGVTSMNYLFYKCEALRSLDLSAFDTSSVVTMYGMFSNCTMLSELTGYENWDTSALEDMGFTFDRVASASKAGALACIDLSRWDLDQLRRSAWCFQICRARQILLPDNLAIMSAGFLNHATKVTGSSFTIPAGVKKIGYAHTIYDFATDDFVEFIVAEGNEHYKAVDGILYSMDGTEMLAVPRNKPFENGVYEIPEGVTFLGELSFSRNYNIHTLVLPDSYVLRYVPVYDEEYIVFKDTGNLNAGSNLSIAIYCYTGITRYEVKDTNPRYSSLNGLIYSKDGKALTAVPARYNAAMEIPEGTERWLREAMWADGGSTVDGLLKDCPGVTLPASLGYIEQEQLAMLNRLHANRAGTANPFTITLDPANTAFYLDETGALCKTEPITITAQPRDWYGLYGETPAISVSAEGEELRYQWYYRDKGKTKWKLSSDCDEAYDSYPLTRERAGRQVYCRITDRNGVSVSTAVAVMDREPLPQGYAGPVITDQPQSWAGDYGEYPAIPIAAEGEGLQYRWYFRDKGKTAWSRSSDCDEVYDSYPLTRARDGREVYCVVTDKYGLSVSSETAVMERYIPAGYTGPVIIAQPRDWTGAYGEFPAITVAAEGEDLHYRWYFRNRGKTAWSRSSDCDDCYDSYALNSTRNGREVYCVVTDKYGFSVSSETAVMSRG